MSRPAPPEQAEQRRGQRLLFVTVLFVLLLTYPLLGIFDQEQRLLGIPVLYLYVLGVWVVLVALTGWLVRTVKN